MDPNFTEEGVGIILIPNTLKGVWMNKRVATKDYVGFYQVAGGSVDPGEDPRQAAVRELREETGIIAIEVQLAKVIQKVYTKPSGVNYRSTQFALFTDTIPKNTEAHKHSDWELIPWKDIPNLQCFDAIQEIFSTN